ncbi:MAG: CCA tRNA nucleotidyltransferase [Actinomycetota bacterium]
MNPRAEPSARAALARLLSDDSPAMTLAGRFRERGHELYLVGGYLRDALLGRARGDLDLATDAAPEETHEVIQPIAASVWLQGIGFGTVGAKIGDLSVEITTFRTERYEAASRHPEVDFSRDIRTDLSRRDFTINAIAVRLPEREKVDPFNGIGDLSARLIKTPGDPIASFTDDPLRMLRAFRFASQLGFTIVDDVLEAIAKLREQILTVSAERIRDELTKLVLGGAPAAALRQAEATGLAELFLPELSSLKLEQDPVHRHKDVFAHTLAVLEQTEPVLELRLAALLHDIGKPKTRRFGPEGVSFHHHEVVGADMARRRLQALRYPNEVVHAVSELIRLHHRFHTYRLGWSDSAVRRYVRAAGPLLGRLNDLVRADCTTRNRDKARELGERMDELEQRTRELEAEEELASIRPELDGNEVMSYLGVPPGRIVGDALGFLLEVRLDEGLIGKEEIIRRLGQWARARGIEPAQER